MADTAGRMADDPIRWKLDRWEKVVPEAFYKIEAAARIEQLAGILGKAMDRVAEEEGLINQGDYQVLSHLRLSDHRGESVTTAEAARQLNMTVATMANRVNRLERLGYVERIPHPENRRASYLAITSTGIVCAERVVLRRTEQRNRMLSAITTAERRDLTDLLRRLAAAWS